MSFDDITRCLSAEDQKIIRDMLSLFDGIDRRTEVFSKQTGLRCKNGCGACCTNPDIETTVAEVLPLAVYLWSRGMGQRKVMPGNAFPDKDVCAFYEPDPVFRTQGRCRIYAYRPGLCRLFGFAARKNKDGQKVLVTCKVIKDSQPQACERAQEGLQKGLEAPLLATHAFSVSGIDPVHGLKLLPINQAISQAVEKVGLRVQNI